MLTMPMGSLASTASHHQRVGPSRTNHLRKVAANSVVTGSPRQLARRFASMSMSAPPACRTGTDGLSRVSSPRNAVERPVSVATAEPPVEELSAGSAADAPASQRDPDDADNGTRHHGMEDQPAREEREDAGHDGPLPGVVPCPPVRPGPKRRPPLAHTCL